MLIIQISYRHITRHKTITHKYLEGNIILLHWIAFISPSLEFSYRVLLQLHYTERNMIHSDFKSWTKWLRYKMTLRFRIFKLHKKESHVTWELRHQVSPHHLAIIRQWHEYFNLHMEIFSSLCAWLLFLNVLFYVRHNFLWRLTTAPESNLFLKHKN
jgi:hypothetical protein